MTTHTPKSFLRFQDSPILKLPETFNLKLLSVRWLQITWKMVGLGYHWSPTNDMPYRRKKSASGNRSRLLHVPKLEAADVVMIPHPFFITYLAPLQRWKFMVYIYILYILYIYWYLHDITLPEKIKSSGTFYRCWIFFGVANEKSWIPSALFCNRDFLPTKLQSSVEWRVAGHPTVLNRDDRCRRWEYSTATRYKKYWKPLKTKVV